MTLTLQAEAPPVREDAAGELRIGDTRVLLELVIRAFQDGATPEAIVQRYSTLALADAYAVVAHYLRRRSEVEGYLAHREQKAEEVWSRIESGQGDLSEIRARLFTPADDKRTTARRALDEQIAAEAPLVPLDLPADAPFSSVESHLGRCRPFAVTGVVENGLIRLLDPGVKLPEHSRVIIVTMEGA